MCKTDYLKKKIKFVISIIIWDCMIATYLKVIYSAFFLLISPNIRSLINMSFAVHWNSAGAKKIDIIAPF